MPNSDSANPVAREDALSMEQRFVLAVASLSHGEVVSYGDIAALAGKPKNSRAVGRFLSNSGLDIPWWRVVRSNGHLVANERQAALLAREGVQLNAACTRVLSSPLGRFAKG